MTDDEMIEAMASAFPASEHGNILNISPVYLAKVAFDAIKPEIDRRVAAARNEVLNKAARVIRKMGNRLSQDRVVQNDQRLDFIDKTEATMEHAAMVRGLKS